MLQVCWELSKAHSSSGISDWQSFFRTRTQGVPHTGSLENNHTTLIRPASKRRTEQATIVHLLFSNFYRQRCFHISSFMFIEENAQATQSGKGLSNSRERGRDACRINPCGLTLTLWTGPKVVLTSLQTDKIHLRGLWSIQTPRSQSRKSHPIHLPKNLLLKVPQMRWTEEETSSTPSSGKKSNIFGELLSSGWWGAVPSKLEALLQ